MPFGVPVRAPAKRHHSMLTRLSLVLGLLLGSLPYVSTVKLPPIATFWPEWVAVLLAIGWLASLRYRAAVDGTVGAADRKHEVAIPLLALGLAAFGAIVVIQLLLHRPLFAGPPELAVASAALAGALCLAGARLRESGESTRFLDAWAVGLLIALGLNFVAFVLDRNGLFVYIYQIVPRPTQERADGLIGQSNQLATLAVLAGLAADYLWLRGRLHASVRVVIAALAALLIVASASRAGAILWFFATALTALAIRSPKQTRGARYAVLLLGVVVFGLIQWAWPAFNVVEGGAGARIFSAGNRERIELLRDSWALIQLHPLTGVGYGNFMSARWMELSGSLIEPAAAHAHNAVAQLGVELGVPGALLVLVPVGLALWACLRACLRREVAPEQFLPASVALVLAGYSLVEFPLWHTYFLLPFALTCGLVAQRDLRVRVSDMSPHAGRLGWAVAALACVGVAVDYRRSEAIALSLLEQNQSTQVASAKIPIQEASNIALLTLFDAQANLMYARTLDFDGSFVDEKLDVTRRAMLSLTGRETIARNVAFLVMAGDTDAAKGLLARTRRTPDLERSTRATLQLLVPKYPPLKPFIAGLPELSVTTAASAP